jgi:Domain of unknown function (DUF5667)
VSAHDRSGQAREDMVVARLRELAPQLDGEPDPGFRVATRARLVAMAAVRTPAPPPVSGLRRLLAARAFDAAAVRWQTRLTAGLAGAALTVTAAAALVAVADSARPGDVLYELKRGTEQTQLALAGDARGRTLLDFASTRLDELAALVGDGDTALPAVAPAGPGDVAVSAAGADAELVLETLHTMDAQTVEGTVWLTDRAVVTTDAGPLELLDRWAARQATELSGLQDLVPDAADGAVGRSLDLLARIGARTDGLQAALDCPAGPAVDGADELGPVPAACSAPEAPAPNSGVGSTSSQAPGPAEVTGPEDTTSASPTVPPSTGTGSGGSSSGSSGSAGLPTVGVPSPSPGGGLVPSLPLPTGVPGGGGTSGRATTSSPATPPPSAGPLTVCLPPLALGGC